jgi:hypothetical protein
MYELPTSELVRVMCCVHVVDSAEQSTGIDTSHVGLSCSLRPTGMLQRYINGKETYLPGLLLA